MDYVKYLRNESKTLKLIADNQKKKPELREAFQAKYDLYDQTMRMLKGGAERGHVVSIITAMQNDLAGIKDPTWTQMGQRQAAYELIKILEED